MLVAAAVLPHPPVLVPAVACGADAELDDLRAVCRDSVGRLMESGAQRLVVIGGAAEPGEWEGSAGGDLRPFGVDASFGGDDHVLPLSLTVGCHLLDDAGWPRDGRTFVAVTEAMSPDTCATIGAKLVEAGQDTSLALLVMGDGSAKRTRNSPGFVDDRAVGYDDAVVNAFEKADVDALLALAPEPARELWVAGRPAWQVLAGASRAACATGASVTSQVRYDAAPYGVGYFVADWSISKS